MKPGDLVYWHEDAWLMSEGIKPKVVNAVVLNEVPSSIPSRRIWNVLRCDTLQRGILHESDLNVRVYREQDESG